jgi:hypothetical protein
MLGSVPRRAAVEPRPSRANCCPDATNGCALAFVEAAWVAVGCSPYFGDFYRRKRSVGKKANSALLATARLMARITWQLLTQNRGYANFPMDQELRCRPVCGSFSPAGPAKGKAAFSQSQEADFFTTDFPQPLRCTTGWSLSSKLRGRTLGQDGGLGICLSQWQGGLHSPPQREV